MNHRQELLHLLPIGVRRPWGGDQRLAQLRPQLDALPPIGECWEVSDVGEEDTSLHSVVADGSDAGQSLRSLIEADPERILGQIANGTSPPRLPLLFKFIEAAQDLSVQVHPDDELARRLGLGPWGKSEAWIILDAIPGATLQVGLKEGWTVESLVELARSGQDISQALREHQISRGDIIHLPAGTIHSIGAGILLAEIQQSSDVTWRVDDGGRVGLDGKPRQLHLDQVLMTTTPPSIDQGPIDRGAEDQGWWRPICSGPIILDELHGEFQGRWPADPRCFSIVVVLKGQLHLEGHESPLGDGDVRFMLPSRGASAQGLTCQEMNSSSDSWVLCASSPVGVR